MNIKHFLVLIFIFVLSIQLEGGYAVVCDYAVAKRLSSRDKAELQIKERNGQLLFQLFMTRYASELFDGKGAKLLACPTTGAQIGGGSIQFWIDDDKTDVAINGKLVGTVKGLQLKNRPDVTFTPSNGIQQKGKCRIQKLASIEFSDDWNVMIPYPMRCAILSDEYHLSPSFLLRLNDIFDVASTFSYAAPQSPPR